MERNLDRRVEAIFPIEAESDKARVLEILRLDLDDDANSWRMEPSGDYVRIPSVTGLSVQEVLQKMAAESARKEFGPSL
jgi:polyphosphate kinase